MVDAEFEAVSDRGLKVRLAFSGYGFAVCGSIIPTLDESHPAAGDDRHL
jgi:hypothetical protein